jgi:uncharacterized membrane protein
MIKKILSIICIIVVGIKVCSAQASGPQLVKSWGKSIEGVQLSITLSNNLIATGSRATIVAEINNSSTNDIYIGESSYNNRDFKVFLESSDGKLFKLTPNLTPGEQISSRMIRRRLKPGESHNWNILVTIGKNIEPGDYMLKATRNVIIDHRSLDLTSNPLKVRIIN